MKVKEDRRMSEDEGSPACDKKGVESGSRGTKVLISNGKEKDRAYKDSDRNESKKKTVGRARMEMCQPV